MQNKVLLVLSEVLLVSVVLSMICPTAFAATEEKVLYSFCAAAGCADGSFPTNGLIMDKAGNLYGTTPSGGSSKDVGVVYELIRTESGWQEKVLHTFFGSGSGFQDGEGPAAELLMDESGNLYGTTAGGGAHNAGTVFELIPNKGKWTEKILYSFSNNGVDGYAPFSWLIRDAKGNLYGTTFWGGPLDDGTVFELSPSKNGQWTEKILLNFNETQGMNPAAGLTFDKAGNLYGTTENGGSANGGGGLVFELLNDNGAWTEEVLYVFGTNNYDGNNPTTGLIFDAAGNLYGSNGAGPFTFGTVFELIPNNGQWTETQLCNDCALPPGELTLNSAGDLLTTSGIGGTYNYGYVFALRPNGQSWQDVVIFNFDVTDGSIPGGGLTLDKSGNIFGVTSAGGDHEKGTVFEITR